MTYLKLFLLTVAVHALAIVGLIAIYGGPAEAQARAWEEPAQSEIQTTELGDGWTLNTDFQSHCYLLQNTGDAFFTIGYNPGTATRMILIAVPDMPLSGLYDVEFRFPNGNYYTLEMEFMANETAMNLYSGVEEELFHPFIEDLRDQRSMAIVDLAGEIRGYISLQSSRDALLAWADCLEHIAELDPSYGSSW